MSLHAPGLITFGIAAYCVSSIAASSNAAAQSRFDVLSVDPVEAVRGMNVYTIRDNQIDVCYNVWAVDSPDAPSSSFPVEEAVPTPEQLEQARVAQELRDAIAIHDRKVADLQKRSFMWSVDYGAERERIEREYEQAVRRVLPHVYPSAQVAPGWPTSTRDELNTAVRRAIAEAEVADRAATQSGFDERIEYLLRRMTASARLGVTGPVSCAPPAAPPVR
jgi:hypothetical protein